MKTKTLKFIFALIVLISAGFSLISNPAYGAGRSYANGPPIDEEPVPGVSKTVGALCPITPDGGSCSANFNGITAQLSVPQGAYPDNVELALVSQSQIMNNPAKLPNTFVLNDIGVETYNADGSPNMIANPNTRLHLSLNLESPSIINSQISQLKKQNQQNIAFLEQTTLNDWQNISTVLLSDLPQLNVEQSSIYAMADTTEFLEAMTADPQIQSELKNYSNIIPEANIANNPSEIQSLESDLTSVINQLKSNIELQSGSGTATLGSKNYELLSLLTTQNLSALFPSQVAGASPGDQNTIIPNSQASNLSLFALASNQSWVLPTVATDPVTYSGTSAINVYTPSFASGDYLLVSDGNLPQSPNQSLPQVATVRPFNFLPYGLAIIGFAAIAALIIAIKRRST
jgi:hypothetical protein